MGVKADGFIRKAVDAVVSPVQRAPAGLSSAGPVTRRTELILVAVHCLEAVEVVVGVVERDVI